MAWVSSVPVAMTNLLATLGAASDLSSVLVLDGPTVTSAPASEAVTVGFTTEGNPEAVSARVRPEGAATTPNRENFTINCAIHVIRGDGNVPLARARAYELLGVIGDAIAANNTLSRAVMNAGIGDHSLTQLQGGKGALIDLRFGVDCDAFTGR